MELVQAKHQERREETQDAEIEVKPKETTQKGPGLRLGVATDLKRNIHKRGVNKRAKKEQDHMVGDGFADLNSQQLTEYRGRNKKLASMREYEQGKTASRTQVGKKPKN
jgi:hypothetical protein